MTNPEVPTSGLGELVRAHRLYVGLTRDAMALKIGMRDDSYDRIERGINRCPAGFIDTLEALSDQFDAEVEETIAQAKAMLDDDVSVVNINVDPDTMDVWHRAVISRAAIESGLIMPILVGIDRPRRKAG